MSNQRVKLEPAEKRPFPVSFTENRRRKVNRLGARMENPDQERDRLIWEETMAAIRENRPFAILNVALPFWAEHGGPPEPHVGECE
jgi:hypothetical protein